jgi:type IV secretory pathway TraG/TraD family ATPase VirD4
MTILAAAPSTVAVLKPFSFHHLHLSSTQAAIACGAGAVLVVLLVVIVVSQANTVSMDRLMVRRIWDYRGIRDYKGTSKNRDVPAGMSVVIGQPVRRGLFGSRLTKPIGAGWEFCTVIYAGPRVGKSTSYVMPSIASAPGAVVATSNKRDLVDATRLIRDGLGDVWIFDPQRVVGAAQGWWWNPLRRITQIAHAQDLAQLWIDTSQANNATPDAYFEPAGTQLLAGLLFAAAVAHKPVTTVFWWLTDPQKAEEAVEILDPRTSLHAEDLTPPARAELESRRLRYAATAQSIAAVIAQPEKQRGGVFGTAMKAVAWMQSPELRYWIEDDTGRRPEFIPSTFATTRDTLYSLSREGSGAVAPLVTALTADVLLTTSELASTMPAGRLPVPMLAALDEAANICPWRQLPRLFSFFGSAAMPILAVFQSPAQVRAAFGPDGAAALHSAANARITMGGIEDIPHLQALEQLVGVVKTKEHSRSSGGYGSGGSRNISWRDRSAVTVAQLAAMGRLRAVVTLSGTAPVLVQPRPWQHNKQLAPQIRASLKRYRGTGTKPPPVEEYDPTLDPKMKKR